MTRTLEANKIITFRRKHGLSPQQLADALGYHTRTIQRLESGEYQPSAHFLKIFDIYICYKNRLPLVEIENASRFCQRVANVFETKYL